MFRIIPGSSLQDVSQISSKEQTRTAWTGSRGRWWTANQAMRTKSRILIRDLLRGSRLSEWSQQKGQQVQSWTLFLKPECHQSLGQEWRNPGQDGGLSWHYLEDNKNLLLFIWLNPVPAPQGSLSSLESEAHRLTQRASRLRLLQGWSGQEA